MDRRTEDLLRRIAENGGSLRMFDHEFDEELDEQWFFITALDDQLIGYDRSDSWGASCNVYLLERGWEKLGLAPRRSLWREFVDFLSGFLVFGKR